MARLAGGEVGERRGARETVHRRPDLVAGDLRRVGKIDKGPGNQGRIHEISAHPPKDLLGEDDPETDTQRNLPQGDGCRQGQGKEQAGDQKGFGHFMAADQVEQPLPE